MGCAASSSSSSAAGDAPPSSATRRDHAPHTTSSTRSQQRYVPHASGSNEPDADDEDDDAPPVSLGSLPPLAVPVASPACSGTPSPMGANRRVSIARSNPTSMGGLRHGSSAALHGRFGSSGRFTGGSGKHWTVTFSPSGLHTDEEDPLEVNGDLDLQNGSNADEARSARSALLSDHMEDSTGLPGPHCNVRSPDDPHANGDSPSLSRVETYSTGCVHVGSQYVSHAPSLAGDHHHQHHHHGSGVYNDHSPHFHLSYSRRTAGSMATTPHGSRPVSPRGDGPLAAWQLARLRAEALSVGERALQSRSMVDWIDGVLAVFDDKMSPSSMASDGEPTTAPSSPRSLHGPLVWSTAATTVVSPAGTGCSYPPTPQAGGGQDGFAAAVHPNAVSPASPSPDADGGTYRD